MRKTSILVGLLVIGGSAQAQQVPDLSSQINAVGTAVNQERADRQAALDAQAQAQAAADAQARADQARAQREAAADRRRAQDRLDREQAARAAKAAKDDAYRDANRDLDLQERKLMLQAEQVRANRENDVINAELKRANAQTDVIQSNADANRNVSSGMKSYLDQSGKAAVQKSSSWYSSDK